MQVITFMRKYEASLASIGADKTVESFPERTSATSALSGTTKTIRDHTHAHAIDASPGKIFPDSSRANSRSVNICYLPAEIWASTTVQHSVIHMFSHGPSIQVTIGPGVVVSWVSSPLLDFGLPLIYPSTFMSGFLGEESDQCRNNVSLCNSSWPLLVDSFVFSSFSCTTFLSKVVDFHSSSFLRAHSLQYISSLQMHRQLKLNQLHFNNVLFWPSFCFYFLTMILSNWVYRPMKNIKFCTSHTSSLPILLFLPIYGSYYLRETWHSKFVIRPYKPALICAFLC